MGEPVFGYLSDYLLSSFIVLYPAFQILHFILFQESALIKTIKL